MKEKIRKVMVAGGAGFIGSQIANKLLSSKYEVVVVDNLSTGERENLNKEIKFYLADISNLEIISEIFGKEKPDAVINEAAKVYWEEKEKDPNLDISTTIAGTVNLLKCCVSREVKKFVFASSVSVYGYPPGKVYLSENETVSHKNIPFSIFSYATTKHAAEQYIDFFNGKFGLSYSILRYGHVYGPGQIKQKDVVSIFIKNAFKNIALKVMGAGEAIRDYVYIEDVVSATITAMNNEKSGLYNIGGGKPVSVNDLAAALKNIFENVRMENVKSGEKADGAYMDISKAKAELGWSPKIGIELGLKETVAYYKKFKRYE